MSFVLDKWLALEKSKTKQKKAKWYGIFRY
jgi:hypothetical protein